MMIGLFNDQNELVDPFVDLDAPIWSDKPPIELYRLAYRYCEELTSEKLGTSITRSSIYQKSNGSPCVQFMHSAVVLMTLQMVTGQTDSPVQPLN